MGDTGSSPGVEQGLVPSGGRYDPFVVERRRREITRLRYVEHMTEVEIRDALAKLKPAITVSQATVSRDLHAIRKSFRHHLSVRGFDAADEVYRHLVALEERELKCWKWAQEAADAKEYGRAAQLTKAANECTRMITRILQDVGLLDRKLGTLIIEDHSKTERVPSGAENVRDLIEGVVVKQSETESPAEIAWKYGDIIESNAAAGDTPDGPREANPD